MKQGNRKGGKGRSPTHRSRGIAQDEFSLKAEIVDGDEQTLGSGFVVAPESSSVSHITDEFARNDSIRSLSSAGNSDASPLATLIGRFNFFSRLSSRKKKTKSNRSGMVSYDLDPFDDLFADDYVPKKKSSRKVMVDSGDLEDKPNGRVLRKRASLRRNTGVTGTGAVIGTYFSRGTKNLNPIDFKEDDPKEMTFGRRIGLSLMKYKWYFPNSDTSALPTQPSLQQVQPVNDDPSGGVTDAAKEDGEKVPKSLGPDLRRSWAYFEHITLPRYITPVGMTRGGKKCCSRFKLLRAKLEKADSGERYLPSLLYDPIFTPLDQMGDFGIGFGLYFSTLRALTMVMLLAGLVSIPNILYFGGMAYDKNQQEGVPLPLRGSAICTDFSFVPCVNCTSSMFSSEEGYRFINNLTSTSDEMQSTLPFALKTNCDGATLTRGMYSLAIMFVIILGMYATSFYLKAREVEFDEDEQTAQDYSIKVKNPPPDAVDPLEWKLFFKKKFGVNVALCTVAVDNDDLILKLVERRDMEQKIKRILGPGHSLELEHLKEVAEETWKKRIGVQRLWAKLMPGLPEFVSKMELMEEEICEMATRERKATQVFIIFETEAAQRKVLSTMKTKDGIDPKYCFREEFLDVDEPSEPSGIRWLDLNESNAQLLFRLIMPTIVTFALIAGAALLVRTVRANSGAYWSAITISLLNVSFPSVAKILTNTEVHRNEGSKQTSLYLKISLFRWVNTAIVVSIITPFTSTIMNGEEHLLAEIYKIFFSEIFITTALQFLDVPGNLARHIFAPRAKTQEEMNQNMRGSEVEIAERYTNMTKMFFLALWYYPIFPAALLLGSISLLINYYADSFSLMRTWTPAPKISSSISRINRAYFLPATVGIMAVVSSYFWAMFTYDNLCPIESPAASYFGIWEIPIVDNEGMANWQNSTSVTIDSSYQFYKFCNQNMFVRGFPALPMFQTADEQWMSDSQERLTNVYGWSSVALLVVVFGHFLLTIRDEINLKFKYQPRGDATDIPFSDSDKIGYVPQVRSTKIPYPLIACSTQDVHDDLYGWSNPYHDYEYYDLTLDVEKIIKSDAKSRKMSDTAFCKVSHWGLPPPHVS